MDADAAATAEFAVSEMSDDPFTVDSPDPYRSREFQLSSGLQFEPLEMYLDPGVYRFRQRSGTAIRRVSTDTDLDAVIADAPDESYTFSDTNFGTDEPPAGVGQPKDASTPGVDRHPLPRNRLWELKRIVEWH